jgi:ribosomal protein S18 acetylase RimI-like enzyme
MDSTFNESERMQIRPFKSADELAVIELWRRCDLVRPQNDSHKDIARKMRVNPELFLVGEIGGKIVATVMAGYDGHRGWINYLAVDPLQQQKGLGREIMAEAELLLRQLGCAKINLQVRTNNSRVIEFYKRIGYSIDDVVGMGKRLEHDESK